jgi:hypothetical protein
MRRAYEPRTPVGGRANAVRRPPGDRAALAPGGLYRYIRLALNREGAAPLELEVDVSDCVQLLGITYCWSNAGGVGH